MEVLLKISREKTGITVVRDPRGGVPVFLTAQLTRKTTASSAFFRSYFKSVLLLYFGRTCRKPSGLAVEYTGGAAHHQDSQGCQQEKSVYRACSSSVGHGVCGSLRRGYDGRADRCSDGTCKLLQSVDDSVAIAAQFLRKGAESVGHGGSHGKTLTQSEEDIEAGNHQNAAFAEKKGEADC